VSVGWQRRWAGVTTPWLDEVSAQVLADEDD